MTLPDDPEQVPPGKVSRLGLYLPAGLLGAACIAWSGFWFYSANLAQERIAEWKTREQAQGRSWDCREQSVEGFPFRLELKCASLVLASSTTHGPVRVESGPLHAVTQIYEPRLILADLSAPLKIESGGTSSQADWSRLRVSIRISDKLERLSIAADEPQLSLSIRDNESISSRAQAAEIHLRADSQRPPAERALDVAVSLQQADIPGMSSLTGTADRTDLNVSGILRNALGLSFQSWPDLLDNWRKAGGSLLIENGRVSQGALVLEGAGSLSLDDARRPQGDLKVAAKGIGPIMARLGGSGMNQLVAPLFEKKDGSAVQWPVRLQDGRIQFGPLRTGQILSPLY